MRKTCLDMVYELAKGDDRVVFIGSDLGVGTLKQFKEQIPDRFFMEGISEANLIGMATGMALEGRVVYVNTIATFLTRRCFEQVVVDLCLHNVPVRLIGSGGGLVYAPLGPTHEAIEDLAIMRAIPRMTVVAPADAEEMRRFMPLTLDYPGPIYIRLAKGGDPVVTDAQTPFKIGQIFPLREGKDGLIISTGITTKLSLDAAALLDEKGINVTVLHVPTIKPLDEETIRAYAEEVPAIVTVEEHTLIGGLGSAVAEVLMEANFSTPKRFKRNALPDRFPDQYGSQNSLLQHFNITPEGIANSLLQLLEVETKPIN